MRGNDRVGVNTSAPETYVDFAVPTVQIRSDATGANEPKLIFNNDLFAGANHGFIQTTNGGLQLDFESGSSSTFTGRAKMQLIGGGGRSIRFYTSTDNGSSFVERLEISNADIIANETGADQDFRVESDTNTHMLFVDGGANKVGMGVIPETVLSVKGGGSNGFTSGTVPPGITLFGQDIDGYGTALTFKPNEGGQGIAAIGSFRSSTYHTDLRFYTNNVASGNAFSEKMSLSGSGALVTNPLAGGHAVFNESGVDADFRVESDSNTHMLFVDASANAIGINQPSPAYALDVLGGTRTTIQTMGVLTNMLNSNWIEVGRWYISNTAQSSRIKITFLGAQGYGENEMGETTFIGTLNNTNDLSGYSWSNAFFTAVSKVAWKYDTDHFKFYVANAQFGAAAPVVYATAGYFEGVANDTGSTSLPAGATEAFYRWQLRLNGSTTSITSISAYETDLVVNEDGIDMNFRVESDSQTHALFVDAGTNSVGIADSAPGASKTFTDTTVACNFFVNSNVATNGPMFQYDKAGVFLGLQNDVGSGTRYFISFGETGTRTGDITSNGSVMTYGGTSDYRLKTNVQPMTGAIDRVKALNPVTFDWISSGISSEGFIAHELQSVIPDAATGTKDEVNAQGKPVYQQVDPRHVVSVLTAALQEAIAKIETLEARIATLEAK
jgi:hypothetical protein